MEITPYATLRVVKKNWRGTMVSLYSTLFLIIFEELKRVLSRPTGVTDSQIT